MNLYVTMSKRFNLQYTSIFNFKRIVAFILLFSIVSGCAGPGRNGYPEFKSSRCIKYKTCQSISDFHLAIQPLQDRNEVIRYFGTDLISAGIVPIFVIAENNSKSSTYMVLVDQISHAMLTSEAKEQTPLEKVGTGAIAFQMILLGPLLGPIAVLGLLGAKQTLKDTVKNRIAISSIRKETLSPAGAQSGFTYLRLLEGEHNNSQVEIIIKVQNIKSKEVHDFKFKINI